MERNSQEKTLEEQADEFLANHDPFFCDRRRNKGRRMAYPYLTPQQLDIVRKKEIPFSNLSDNQANQCVNRGCDTTTFRKEMNDNV